MKIYKHPCGMILIGNNTEQTLINRGDIIIYQTGDKGEWPLSDQPKSWFEYSIISTYKQLLK
jgi:hypothetical protein